MFLGKTCCQHRVQACGVCDAVIGSAERIPELVRSKNSFKDFNVAIKACLFSILDYTNTPFIFKLFVLSYKFYPSANN
jgi:hypothetical protein